ncbi:HEPN domain-containing protein [uncultured Methanobrevibacter sp.]|uniref:HEPN domain-containing protein n=1 Tax=uncultured Methanobrevibacter sp. TaxID=253161 RepID=UPI0025E8E958|nr:HEPN domain-containing protein [uncultured Methanobrevibacter sp.]
MVDEDVMGNFNLAKEELISAKILLDAGRYRDCVTLSYYAMFDAAKALLLSEGFSSKKHDTTLKQFSLEFVHKKGFDIETYKYYSNAKRRRNKSSYDYSVEFSEEEAEIRVSQAEEFIMEAERFL